MFGQLFDGTVLIIVTVAIHVLALSWGIKRLRLRQSIEAASLLSVTLLLSRVAVLVILAHLIEIVLWSSYFWYRGVLPTFEESFYFSAVTYATIGYGDIVPPPDWRLIASMEGLTGILMCAWSGGFFFALVSRFYDPTNAQGNGR